MRLDRFIALSVAQPLQSVFGRVTEKLLPVLMYHSISRQPEADRPAYFKVSTAPDRFRLQMCTLRANGYQGVDLETGLEWLNLASPSHPVEHAKDRAEPPNAVRSPRRDGGQVEEAPIWPRFGAVRPVAITFDDGFRDFFTEALPILAEHNFSATMYLPTDFIHRQRRSFRGLECMTWAEVLESQRLGICFGSHTRSHPKLDDLPWPEIESELRDSKAELEDQTGRPSPSFAYPYAFPEMDRQFCGRLRGTLIDCGYRSCATTIAGRVVKGADSYALRRLPMNGEDDAALLLAKLDGAYDWMKPAQRCYKLIKRWVGR